MLNASLLLLTDVIAVQAVWFLIIRARKSGKSLVPLPYWQTTCRIRVQIYELGCTSYLNQ